MIKSALFLLLLLPVDKSFLTYLLFLFSLPFQLSFHAVGGITFDTQLVFKGNPLDIPLLFPCLQLLPLQTSGCIFFILKPLFCLYFPDRKSRFLFIQLLCGKQFFLSLLQEGKWLSRWYAYETTAPLPVLVVRTPGIIIANPDSFLSCRINTSSSSNLLLATSVFILTSHPLPKEVIAECIFPIERVIIR